MQTIRDNSVLLNGPDTDVWDRVMALAPKSEPVRVGLFRRPVGQDAFGTAAPESEVRRGSVVPDTALDRSYPWEKFPVATLRAVADTSSATHADQTVEANADAQSFDLLRTRLLQALNSNGLTSVAITSPSPGCGTTFTATNLALSLARLPSCRTLLIDLNFRSPGVAETLKLVSRGSLRKGLLGIAPLTSCLARFGANLMVGMADQSQPDPAEMLMDPRTIAKLASLKKALKPDVIIYDLPPMLAYDDATALLPQVDGVLLVTDGTKTVANQITQCQNILADKTKLLGVVLNKTRTGGTENLRYADV